MKDGQETCETRGLRRVVAETKEGREKDHLASWLDSAKERKKSKKANAKTGSCLASTRQGLLVGSGKIFGIQGLVTGGGRPIVDAHCPERVE